MSGSPCMFPAQHDGECVCALVGTSPLVTAAPGPQQPDEVRLIEALTFIGQWVDASLADRVQEVRDRVRITKVCEESGEVWSALDRVYGANPRKTGSWDEVDKELLDTAGAALGAIEYRRGYDGQSLRLLADHMAGVAARAAAHAARAEVHEPYEDDGVTYCGWASGTGVTGGCGELWPCSTVRAHPAAPSAQPDRVTGQGTAR